MEQQEAERQFERLIMEHQPLLRKICRLYAYTDFDRQDLFQEMVIQLWKAYPKFRGQAQVSTWLYRVGLNTAITGLRKQKQHISPYGLEGIHERISDEMPGHEEEQLRQLYKAIEQLGEVDKAIVMLYMEDHSYGEMEEILGIGQGNLRVKMNRIKEKLRQLTKND